MDYSEIQKLLGECHKIAESRGVDAALAFASACKDLKVSEVQDGGWAVTPAVTVPGYFPCFRIQPAQPDPTVTKLIDDMCGRILV